MSDLRKRTIRLALGREELRIHLLPLLKMAGEVVELTDPEVTEAQVLSAHPYDLRYKGEELFEIHNWGVKELVQKIDSQLRHSLFETSPGIEIYWGYSSILDLFVCAFEWFHEGDQRITAYGTYKIKSGKTHIMDVGSIEEPSNHRAIEDLRRMFKIDFDLDQ